MPWATPTLRQVREMVRDDITAALDGAVVLGNSVLRVMADAKAGLAHLVLRYIDWLARQLMPDTAEREWLDRHGDIWLTNADNSTGRKAATLAEGTINVTGTDGTLLPVATRFTAGDVTYETTEQVFLSTVATEVDVRALTAGTIGNLDADTVITLDNPIAGVDGDATVVLIAGGVDEEDDDDLRSRVLLRIRNPPMGGCKTDFEQWALAVPGVTRAWCYPLEMGMGTVTVRFMMDDLREAYGGFPDPPDVTAVSDFIDTKRPVAVKDFFVVAPLAYPLNMTIANLEESSASVQEAIEQSLTDMLRRRAEPGQTIYKSWVSEAISAAIGEDHHDLTFENTVMPSTGHLATLGIITYG